jgi:glycogen debranching enzyme
MDYLLDQAYQKSIELLHRNSTPYGFQAAPSNSEKPEYRMLFGRDSAICALCVLDHPDQKLSQTAQLTLESLRNSRSPLGQVPFRVDMETGYKDFWYPGNVDSTLWWVLASLKMVQLNPRLRVGWRAAIDQSMTWLRYQDVAEVGLIMQGQRSDWADEMPNHGAVLYSNALWYKVVTEYGKTYGVHPLIDEHYAGSIHQAFNLAFWPYDGLSSEAQEALRQNRAFSRAVEWAQTDLVLQPYYISYLSRRSYGRRCDMLANVLAMLFGLCDGGRQLTIERFMQSVGISRPYPGKALYPVIYPGEPEWQEGMASRNQNVPYQYHNGGIWPFIGGFWVTYLAMSGQSGNARVLAEQALGGLAKANALNDWEFNEYLHGEHGTPMGIAHQSWNAALYIAAYRSVNEGRCLMIDGVKLPPATPTTSPPAGSAIGNFPKFFDKQ